MNRRVIPGRATWPVCWNSTLTGRFNPLKWYASSLFSIGNVAFLTLLQPPCVQLIAQMRENYSALRVPLDQYAVFHSVRNSRYGESHSRHGAGWPVVSGKRIRRLVYLGQLRDPAPLAEVPTWTHCLVSTHSHLFAIPA